MMWSGIDKFATQGVQFVLQIVLARMLLPEDYGIIAMLAIFLAVGETFIDSGFSRALIQKNDCTENDYTTTLIFNIVVGVVAFLLLFSASGVIADFYNIPLLAPIAKAMGVVFICNSLCIVQQAMLTIRLDFRRQTIVSLTSVIVAGGVAVYMAYRGFGPWCIAVQAIVQALLRCILFWVVCAWWPAGRFDKKAFNRLFNFGSKLLASALINTVYNNLYTLFVGKVFSSKMLGFFARADQFAALPSSTLTGVMQRVVFPVLSKLKGDDKELRAKYIIFLRLASSIVFPAMVGIICVAKPLVIAFLTEKWAMVVVLLQIVSVAYLWRPIHAINLSLLEVKGRTDLFLKTEIVKKMIGSCILLVSMSFSIYYVCIGVALSSTIGLFVNTYYSHKLLNLGLWVQLKKLVGVMGGCAWMALCIFLWNILVPIQNVWGVLWSNIAIGIVMYIAYHAVLHTMEFAFFVQLIKERRS